MSMNARREFLQTVPATGAALVVAGQTLEAQIKDGTAKIESVVN